MHTTAESVEALYNHVLLPLGIATAPHGSIGWPRDYDCKGRDRALSIALALAAYAAGQARQSKVGDLLDQLHEGLPTAVQVCATGRDGDISTLQSCAAMLCDLAGEIASEWYEEIAQADYPAALEVM